MHLHQQARNDDLLLPEVDLHLLARLGLEAHGRGFRRSLGLPVGCDDALDGANANLHAVSEQLAGDHDGIALSDGCKQFSRPLMPLVVELSRFGAHLNRHRVVRAQIAPDGISGDAQFVGDPLGAPVQC
ncbi:hypothetical protein D3C72_1774710 [compost metagenome]